MLHHLTKKNKKALVDYITYFFVFTTPLFELPQALTIYLNQSATDVSLTTWGYFLLSNAAWLIYGAYHKLKPILIIYSLYMLVEVAIVIGILMYR